MEEGNQSEQVKINVELLNSITKRLKEYSSNSDDGEGKQAAKPTIHRVPDHLRQGDESAYEPKIISIGPYYHGSSPGLVAMEDQKWLSLHKFTQRKGISLEQCLLQMQRMEEQARSCYSDKIEQKSSEFVLMLLLDGCFIIELFLKRTKVRNELIYSTRWMLPLITNDLLLLENQLPFFVLERVFELADLKERHESVENLAIHFFKHLLPEKENPLPSEPIHHLLHLLHLFHSRRLVGHPSPSPSGSSHSSSTGSMQQQEFMPDTNGAMNSRWKTVKLLVQAFYPSISKSQKGGLPAPAQKSIPGAVELHEAGVKFKVKKEANSYLEVTFQNGVMEIPYLLIKDTTSTLFRNFIGFEQCHPDSDCHFTSYAFFMDCIVNTPADVALLGKHKIIEHWLGEDEAVALLFNSLCKGVAIDTQTRQYFPMLFKDVRDYCETNWHTWRARLMHDYFSNPWAIVSVFAAIVLLVLTVAQTVFGVLEYTEPP